MRPKLRRFRDENGIQLFDILDAPFPAGDVPVPPVLIVEMFEKIPRRHQDDVIAEAHRVLAFAAGDKAREIVLS